MSGTTSLAVEGPEGTSGQPTVDLRLPADGAYAAMVRTLAAGLAARLDFTMDDIEDVRMVVSEATALVLEQAGDDAELHCAFTLDDGRLQIRISTATTGQTDADYESFGWQVLAVLAEDAAIDTPPGRYGVTATVASSLRPGGE